MYDAHANCLPSVLPHRRSGPTAKNNANADGTHTAYIRSLNASLHVHWPTIQHISAAPRRLPLSISALKQSPCSDGRRGPRRVQWTVSSPSRRGTLIRSQQTHGNMACCGAFLCRLSQCGAVFHSDGFCSVVHLTMFWSLARLATIRSIGSTR